MATHEPEEAKPLLAEETKAGPESAEDGEPLEEQSKLSLLIFALNKIFLCLFCLFCE